MLQLILIYLFLSVFAISIVVAFLDNITPKIDDIGLFQFKYTI